MKPVRVALCLLVVLAAASAVAQNNSQAAFEKIKSLEGSWSAKGSEGQPLHVTFRVVSGGSAVMSEIQGKGEEDMITMFHLDGDRLLMTHYCGVGNQPRMTGSLAADGKSISFAFVDATNVLKTQPGHMANVVLTMPDANHHSEAWTFQGADAKENHHEVFELQRAQ